MNKYYLSTFCSIGLVLSIYDFLIDTKLYYILKELKLNSSTRLKELKTSAITNTNT